jgi:polysaccharide export outer membrane protein
MNSSNRHASPSFAGLGHFALVLGLLGALGGCALPRSVSSLKEVEGAAKGGSIVLVPASEAALPKPVQYTSESFPAEIASSPEYDFNRIDAGDRLAVRIWESGTPTVFSATGGTSDLGEITVDESGRLYLPYVGSMHVAGMTIPQVRSAVIGKLRTVILNPQVDIRPVDHRSALVSVQGTAAKTGSISIDRGRTRLGQLLAEVAPDQKNPDMTNVTLRRDGASGTVRLSDIYRIPALDVALRPDDAIIITEVVQNVTVLGSAGVQGEIRIPKRDFSLIDALGAARGLNEDTADPRAVFLMRASATPNTAPTVYQFDMRRPDAIALASRTVLQDKDAILISTAPFAQTRKVLQTFSQSLSGLRSATLIVP